MRTRSLILVFLFFLAFVGCEHKTRHKVLSVFFDGVPPLEEQKPTGAEAPESQEKVKVLPTDGSPQPVKFTHKPYEENQCWSCHMVTQGNAVIATPELCVRCHQDAQTKGKVVHAPVAGGECLSCHNPHESPLEHLLTSAVPALCMGCHEGGGEHVEEMAANQTVCTECHDPHSSDDSTLLK